MGQPIKMTNFGGMVPAVDSVLLPDPLAAHSENTWLYSGRLTGLPQPTFIKSLGEGTARVYRIPNNFTDAKHISDSVWLEFENADTDVIRSTVIDDQFDRYYWVAPNGQPPKYNTLARIKAASPEFILGVPAPAAPGVAVVGGSAANVTRSYLVTWVTAYGEEGPAGAPTVVTGHPDGSWNVTMPVVAAGDLGTNRNLTLARIYRTITSTAGVATYFLVAEVAIATTTYGDTLSDTVVSLNSQINSTNWTAPPDDLEGWVTMPNGIIAGFRKNEVWFCEPYRPHAWPAQYAITVDYPIVGLGVTGQTLVVCTEVYPWTVTGVHPSTMAEAKSAQLEPCMSRGSILSTGDGVFYSSPNGLVFAAGGVIQNVTEKLATKDKWQQLTAVTSLRAARLGTAYYAFGSAIPGVFQQDAFQADTFAQEDFTGAYAGILIDPRDARIAYNLLSDRTPVSSVFNDPWTGEVFIVKDNNLYWLDIASKSLTPQVYKWRSRIFELNDVQNYGAMRVRWRTPANAPAATTDPVPMVDNGAEYPSLPAGVVGYVRAYAGNGDDKQTMVWERELRTSGEIMKLASGFKAEFWQFEFETYVEIVSVQVAGSAKGLASE